MAARDAMTAYGRRFKSDELTLSRFAPYRLRPTRVKLFDERELGGGVFVSARVRRDGTLAWTLTETYRDTTRSRRRSARSAPTAR